MFKRVVFFFPAIITRGRWWSLDLFSYEKAGAKRDLFSRIWVFCSRYYEFRMLLLLRLPNLHWNLNKEKTGNTFQFFEEKVIVPNVCLNWLEKNSGDKKEEWSYIGLFIPIADAKISFCEWSICFPVKTSLKIVIKTAFDSECKLMSQIFYLIRFIKTGTFQIVFIKYGDWNCKSWCK